MSLALLQGYSSAKEEEENDDNHPQLSRDEVSTDEETNDAVLETGRSYKPLFDPNPPSSSSLPSAFAVFSEEIRVLLDVLNYLLFFFLCWGKKTLEVTGPPQFLNNSVQEDAPKEDEQRWRRGGRRYRKEKKDIPSGAVVESKAQLVGIHERVRSDIEGNISKGQANGTAGSAPGGINGMCVSCGIPKTYSHAKGMVCPVCGDRPPVDSDKENAKKKGSAVKDKEKSKRMKGQSSHATWKSETEMHLRQQFD
ncbi:hypothetical protein PHJA_000850900 [Phtheirospermum japonicum]|uniref:Uncharacterized protein n=1 Tax=Phtheirospermum japonicum TaxID=374723 RepID=A0A830BYF7_9LAMI|nr:hypothetical protein PHJA_000850900 [Phtheirospermum japonicum]